MRKLPFNEADILAILRIKANMTIPIYIAGVAILGFFLYRFLYGTDTPHIKGLPEVPGLPLFGSLFELGTNHAKVAQGWAKKYGPVFQVRMGNRVSRTTEYKDESFLILGTENRIRQLFRLSPPSLDHQPVCPHLSTYASHFPHCCLFLARFHYWHFAMGRVVQEPTQGRSHRSEPTSCTIIHAPDRPRVDRLHQRTTT
jgi:hypothetical protein